MGSFDGAEVCELVGLYILSNLEERFGKEKIGLYRDDGLAVLKTNSGRKADKTREDLIQIFNKLGLKITAEANLKIVHFLDVTFNLANSTYFPYRKPNDEPMYINSRSNHPKSILTQLPKSINNRLSQLSCNEETFQTASAPYQEALTRSNYNHTLTYTDDNPRSSQRRNRRRKPP